MQYQNPLMPFKLYQIQNKAVQCGATTKLLDNDEENINSNVSGKFGSKTRVKWRERLMVTFLKDKITYSAYVMKNKQILCVCAITLNK